MQVDEVGHKNEEVEKRAVMRDGRIPKFQKNIEKMRQREIEMQARREGWLVEEQERKRKEQLAKKPLKIRAAAYGAGVDARVMASTDKNSVTAKKLNVKF